MMIVQVDKMSAPSKERAQQLLDKVLDLENRRRRSAQARVPSDPNAWQQMRENYEAIILEDHAFSEQHNIEFALWQLHYRRIEELRAHLNTALSSGSNQPQGAKGPPRPDRLTKIRLQFKTFLSEASGFYHDLIVKIKAKYGLPLGYFSENSETQNMMEKDGNRSFEVKKGLISCHRCLIYLGDLGRYKGLYGDSDSKGHEFTAASSYYFQAASLLPSSGNPHHQLAILASYSGDELVAVYRYFRSLAVDSPFLTARENLVVAFEKNRNAYSQLPGEATGVKESRTKSTAKTRGKGEAKNVSRDIHTEPVNEGGSIVQDKHKEFYIRFIRLNGILFTRTSMEIFPEVLALVSSGLSKLLSGPEEELTFGADAAESGLIIVRIVSILIFTVHNVNRESEGTYADILQRKALLKNAYTAVFKLMSHIFERCAELKGPSSSFLLPGMLIFTEWLACSPDVSAGSAADEGEAVVRSGFWSTFVAFLNKLLSEGTVSLGYDEDETCFNNMTSYEEGNTENRLALWEDFELRGFVPLVPAQTFLDFSRKHTFASDGKKERIVRSERILAAGKVLASVVKVDKKGICFDPRGSKFVIGSVPPVLSDTIGINMVLETQVADEPTFRVVQSSQQVLEEEDDDDDEVIVFKPIVSEKHPDVLGSNWATYEGLKPIQNTSAMDVTYSNPMDVTFSNPTNVIFNNNATSGILNDGPQTAFGSRPLPVSVSNALPQYFQPVQPHVSRWPTEEALSDSFQGLRFTDNGHGVISEVVQGSNPMTARQTLDVPTSGMQYSYTKPQEIYSAATLDVISASGAVSNTNSARMSALPVVARRAPVSRPSRHIGPPPGFNRAPGKQVNETGFDTPSETPIADDYSWLDGYHVPPWNKGSVIQSSTGYPAHLNPHAVTNSNGVTGTVNFPFHLKQVPAVPPQSEMEKGYAMRFDSLKLQHEQHMLQQQQLQQQQQQQQVMNGNPHMNPLPEQYHGQSGRTGRYYV